MVMLGEIFNVVAPIFVCCGIGFFWVKNGFDYDASFITRLVTNIGFPCLLFSVMFAIFILVHSDYNKVPNQKNQR